MSFEALKPVLQTARKRYLDYLVDLRTNELTWKLADGSNSIGFLIRHIAEVEYRYCMMFFGKQMPADTTLITIGNVRDEGQHTDLESLLSFKDQSYEYLTEALENLPASKWDEPVEAFIGVLTPREALGRLVFHTGYHAGQIGLIRKYGPKE